MRICGSQPAFPNFYARDRLAVFDSTLPLGINTRSFTMIVPCAEDSPFHSTLPSGSIVYDDCALAKAALVDSSGNRWPVDYEDETPLSRVIRDFTEAIREQRPQFAGLILGGQVTEILSSAERSIAGSREMG